MVLVVSIFFRVPRHVQGSSHVLQVSKMSAIWAEMSALYRLMRIERFVVEKRVKKKKKKLMKREKCNNYVFVEMCIDRSVFLLLLRYEQLPVKFSNSETYPSPLLSKILFNHLCSLMYLIVSDATVPRLLLFCILFLLVI